jgi:nucleoside 2-deoxyribosyltransferase/transposase-like protein
MTQNQTTVCPICGENYAKEIRQLESGVMTRYKCERCGSFDIDHVLVTLKDKPWDEVKHLVSAWVRRENKSGIPVPNIAKGAGMSDVSSPEWWANQFRHMGFPETTNEKLDALLLAYADSVSGIYQERIKVDQPELISIVAAKNIDEIKGLTSLLEEMGHLRKVGKAYGALTISAQGWLHTDELRKAIIASNSAFVAMWFDDSTKKYRNAVIAAIEHCGYKAIVVDQQEYNDFIMNQVISLIRQSRFLVADFTSHPEIENDGKVKNGVRGGVYWEAGMAYGLGRPVIHTCEDSGASRSRIHFDVNQYNTIFWKEDELNTEIRPLDQPRTNPNFAEKLAARILATVGKGSYPGDAV